MSDRIRKLERVGFFSVFLARIVEANTLKNHISLLFGLGFFVYQVYSGKGSFARVSLANKLKKIMCFKSI